MTTAAYSPEQVLALPAMPSVKDAFAAMNIGPTTGYALVRDGQFPIEVIPFGRALRVRRSDLVQFLGLTDAPGDTPALGGDDE